MGIESFLRRERHLTAVLATVGVLGAVVIIGLVQRVDLAPSISGSRLRPLLLSPPCHLFLTL
jgi:hypothetical protein